MKEINDMRHQTGKATIEQAHCVWHRDKIMLQIIKLLFKSGWLSHKNWTIKICCHWYYLCETARNG